MNLELLKKEIREKFPESVLYQVLEAEPDDISDEQVMAKLNTWLKLSKM